MEDDLRWVCENAKLEEAGSNMVKVGIVQEQCFSMFREPTGVGQDGFERANQIPGTHHK